MPKESCIYVALPIFNEAESIDQILSCLKLQKFSRFEIVACVNQYDSLWQKSGKKSICEDNHKCMELLKGEKSLNIHIIDRSTKGKGWPAKKGGVGWARKTIMDYIVTISDKDDIIVSIDADTYYPPDYLTALFNYFACNPKSGGLAIPYYHKLTNDFTDRLILRYEIYMRYYLLNMIRINNPYSYTALGSAMAFPVWAYCKVGGLTPVPAGEDFYFLQKLVKSMSIGLFCPSVAYPSPRMSDRVIFGTGPALIKGNTGNWDSYPHYHYSFFDQVEKTYNLFSQLYLENIEMPMDEFLIQQYGTKNIWEPLRKNYKDQKNFERACINKVDGLRILQFLRKKQATIKLRDEEIIYDYLSIYFKEEIDNNLLMELAGFDYLVSPIKLLSELRDFLFLKEMEMRKKSI